jgi:acetylornithine deacetylase
VATVEGGSAVNIIPDHCAIGLGFRILPGMQAEEITERIQVTVAEALGERPFSCEILSESPPMALGPEVDLYRDLSALLGQRNTVSASFATDAGWLQNRGLDCLLFGPGNIKVAHRPNEFLPKAELAQADTILQRLIDRYCL